MKIKLFTIPNLLTLSNLLCGMIATVAILTDGDLHLAFWLLVLAAVFDFFDGFTARLLHQSSPIGLQLDSLADMVSSGVAPTAVMLTLAWQAGSSWWTADTGGPWSWIVLLLAVGTALRLAKFNIDDTQRTEFCGLPSPAAGLFCASLGLLHAEGMLSLPYEAVLLAAAATAWLIDQPDPHVRTQIPRLRLEGQPAALSLSGGRASYLFLRSAHTQFPRFSFSMS